MRSSFNVKNIAMGGIAIALSFILSYVKLFQFPQGGSVTLVSMLPIIIYVFIAGPVYGMIAGVCYGLLQYLQEPFFLNFPQFLFDYIFAFSSVVLAGLFKVTKNNGKNRYNIVFAVFAVYFTRFVFHVLSGVIFFAEYAGEMNPIVYSVIYNGTYLGVEMLAAMIICLVPQANRAFNKISAMF